MYKLDQYLDFTPLQKDLTKKKLKQLHAWHRTEELSKYSDYLTSIKIAVENDLTLAKIDRFYHQIDLFRADLLLEVVPYAADLFTKIDDAQLDHLEKKLNKENDKIRRQINRSRGIKRENRMKEAKANTEKWIGTLKPEQIKMISRFLDAAPEYNKIKLARRLSTQKIFFQALRDNRHQLRQNAALLTDVWVNSYSDPSIEYNQTKAIFREKYKAFILELYQSLTEEQKTFLITKLALFIRDIKELRETS